MDLSSIGIGLAFWPLKDGFITMSFHVIPFNNGYPLECSSFYSSLKVNTHDASYPPTLDVMIDV